MAISTSKTKITISFDCPSAVYPTFLDEIKLVLSEKPRKSPKKTSQKRALPKIAISLNRHASYALCQMLTGLIFLKTMPENEGNSLKSNTQKKPQKDK
jgi:hypothetical protein